MQKKAGSQAKIFRDDSDFHSGASRSPLELSKENILGKSWTFIKIFVDIWLTGKSGGLPSATTLAGLRFLLKHIHSFVAAPTPLANADLHNFKTAIISQLPLDARLISLYPNNGTI